MPKKIEIEINQRFGKLIIIQELGRIRFGLKTQRQFLCQCDCGEQSKILLSNLRSGKIKSCGCSQFDGMKESRITHGLSHHSLFSVWCGMKRRCYNPHEHKYSRYGGRGIKLCDEWKNDFQAFYDWAIANGYQKGLQIDRINNDGNYEPCNCRFVTIQENINNRPRRRERVCI